MGTDNESSGLRTAVQISFLVLVFSLGFMQPDVRVMGISITLSEPIFLLTGALWLIALISGRLKIRFDKVYFLFGLYALALFLSALFSENQRQSLFKFLGEAYLIGLAVLAFSLSETPNFLKRVVFVWLAASAVGALIGALTVAFFYLGYSNFLTDLSLHDFGSLPPGNYPRIQGTFFYPSLLCNYLTVSLMMLFAAQKLGWINGLPFAILLVLFSTTIAFTLTPGLGGVFLAIGIWIWYIYRAENRIFSRVALSGGVLAALMFLVVSTFTLINTPTSPYSFNLGGVQIDPTQRLLTWQGASQTFLAHPIFGKGLGLRVAEVYFMPPSGELQFLSDAHNALLSVAAQAGILGAIPLVLICVAVLRRSLRFSAESSLLVAVGIAFASAFVYQGLVGSFEDARHLWVLIGLIMAYRGEAA